MNDILQDLPVRAPLARVFEMVSTPQGLNQWWTETCAGEIARGRVLELGFGPEYQWLATVTQYVEPVAVEFAMTRADADWQDTRVRFELSPSDNGTILHFSHRGWPDTNEHYRSSCHCWALYLRLLRRHVEFGETVPYSQRLDV